MKSFETANAARFNRNNPDREEVYYQSYAFVMKRMTSDIFMAFSWLVVKLFEGENDGLLAPVAVKWTNFKGVCYGGKRRGISYCDEVDMRRHRLCATCSEGIYDITRFYLDIAEDLEQRGF